MTTTTYTAGIRHHSVAQAPEITVTGTLAQAKRAATARFGDGFQDHELVILDTHGDVVATRRLDAARWTDRS
jgi:hypothetical protein